MVSKIFARSLIIHKVIDKNPEFWKPDGKRENLLTTFKEKNFNAAKLYPIFTT